MTDFHGQDAAALGGRKRIILPKHHTQVDPEWARAILAAHQPRAVANHCDVCFVRWPCEVADLAATVLALYEVIDALRLR